MSEFKPWADGHFFTANGNIQNIDETFSRLEDVESDLDSFMMLVTRLSAGEEVNKYIRSMINDQ